MLRSGAGNLRLIGCGPDRRSCSCHRKMLPLLQQTTPILFSSSSAVPSRCSVPVSVHPSLGSVRIKFSGAAGRLTPLRRAGEDSGGGYGSREETEEEEEDDVTPATPSTRSVHPSLDVKINELEELPEQWRRTKVAWLCKELPSHRVSTFTRILNAQRKWITQDDASYLVVHCLRIRDSTSAFRTYKWMARQRWFRFDFPLATRLADFLGKDRKLSKCREIFDQIVARGRVPSESTFHVLIVAYLSANEFLEEACEIYNRMVQSGGYTPRLSLQNSLFRAILHRPGASAKPFLDRAEFIFSNMETVHKDVYAGLIWLHSYQDRVDWKRMEELRDRMRISGLDESSKEVLVSVLRACSKLESEFLGEADKAWTKLLTLGSPLPSQAFVYRMDLYAKVGQPMRALEVFRSMSSHHGISPNVVCYQKIIEVATQAKDFELAESLMSRFMESGMKPLAPSFLALMEMYLDLNMHGELESCFSRFLLSGCPPNPSVYTLYLDFLVRNHRIEEAEDIFNGMHADGAIGTDARICNIILGGFLGSDKYLAKAAKVFDMMSQKKYDVEPALLEKLDYYYLGLKGNVVKKQRKVLKLDQEQREILVGLLLCGGVQIETDENRKIHALLFQFNGDKSSSIHSIPKAAHLQERFHEWLRPPHYHNNLATADNDDKDDDDDDEIPPHQFATIKHLCFSFYAEQFWRKGKLVVPTLIHRWMSMRSLAYWYMYGGLKTASGDILIKLKTANHEDVERIVQCFLMKSLDCRRRRVEHFGLDFKEAMPCSF